MPPKKVSRPQNLLSSDASKYLKYPFSFWQSAFLAIVFIILGIGLSKYATRCASSSSFYDLQEIEDLRNMMEQVPVRRARIDATYPHDQFAFTQGLSWHGGALYESTGMHGKSSLRHVELETGKVLRQHTLAFRDFGEGCVAIGDELIQIVWKTGTGYVYRMSNFEILRTFRFDGDGWGLAVDDENCEVLYLSDGSDEIRVMKRLLVQDPFDKPRYRTAGLEEIDRLKVRNGRNGPSVALLNELEVIDGEVWANIWMSDLVARIDKHTGLVNSWVDMRGMLSHADIPPGHKVDVLNGIAHDPSTGRIFVTGKLWPRLYEISVEPEIAEKSIERLDPFFTDPTRVKYIMSLTL